MTQSIHSLIHWTLFTSINFWFSAVFDSRTEKNKPFVLIVDKNPKWDYVVKGCSNIWVCIHVVHEFVKWVHGYSRMGHCSQKYICPKKLAQERDQNLAKEASQRGHEKGVAFEWLFSEHDCFSRVSQLSNYKANNLSLPLRQDIPNYTSQSFNLNFVYDDKILALAFVRKGTLLFSLINNFRLNSKWAII